MRQVLCLRARKWLSMGHGFRGLDVWFSASGSGVVGSNFRCPGFIVNPRKLEHGFRRISAMIPYTLPEGHEDTHVPIFRNLL